MLYNNITRRAMVLAELMFRGVYDKGGFPYIHHAIYVGSRQTNSEGTVVGLLHDVIEDKRNLPEIDIIDKSDILPRLGICEEMYNRLKERLAEAYEKNNTRQAIRILCKEMRFNEEVETALIAITRDLDKSNREDYMKYIKKLSDNSIARKVKLIDLEHNLNETRLTGTPAEGSHSTLQKRYIEAQKFLKKKENR